MAMVPEAHGGRPQPQTVSNDLNAILEHWLDGLSSPREGDAVADRTAGGDDVRSAPSGTTGTALDAIRVRRGVVSVPGAPPIAVGWKGARAVYVGSASIRGPLRPPEAVWVGLGLAPAARAAFEFVAAWFGAAFDAVNLREPGASWGIWHLRGTSLAETLSAWKALAPVAFETALGVHGIDAFREEERSVLVVPGARGSRLRGAAAVQAVTKDPRLVALLALAARDPDCRTAQLQVTLRRHVLPALAIPIELRADAPPRRLSDALSGSRAIAVALHAELAGTAAGLRTLASAIGGEGVERGLQAYAGHIAREGSNRQFLQLSRILSSPELEDAPAVAEGCHAPAAS